MTIIDSHAANYCQIIIGLQNFKMNVWKLVRVNVSYYLPAFSS